MTGASASPAAPPSRTPSVDIRGVVKRYPLFSRRRDRALALLGRTSGLAHKTALDGVSLQVYPGEAFGVIGENGSGKSTLLRLVAGISDADAGELRVTQPVSAILELGLGFHPEFTGRQNALLYGGLIGVPEPLMRERLAEVLAFAELGEFADLPLRTYSSGMAARLAFAVATHVDPRVLVVDEALAVGDAAFQKKCVDHMVRFKEGGRTVLFCSHAMYLVAGFCERAVWLLDGKVAAAGPARDVINAYEDYLRHKGKRSLEPDRARPPEARESLAALEGVTIEPAGRVVRPGEPLAVHVTLRRTVPNLPVHVAVIFEQTGGFCVAAFATAWDGEAPLVAPDRQTIVLRLPACPFARGEFDVTAFLGDETGLQVLDQLLLRRAFLVAAPRWEPGLLRAPHSWQET